MQAVVDLFLLYSSNIQTNIFHSKEEVNLLKMVFQKLANRPKLNEVENFDSLETERGQGGFGLTGLKKRFWPISTFLKLYLSIYLGMKEMVCSPTVTKWSISIFDDPDSYIKNVQIINFDMIHGQCRGQQMENSALAVKFVPPTKITDKPAKPPTNHSNYPQTSSQTSQIPKESPANQPKMAWFFPWRNFLWTTTFSSPIPYEKRNRCIYLMFPLDFAFCLLHCTVLYHP